MTGLLTWYKIERPGIINPVSVIFYEKSLRGNINE